MEKIILFILCFSIYIIPQNNANAIEEKDKFLGVGAGLSPQTYYSYNFFVETKIYKGFKLFGEIGLSKEGYGLAGIKYYIGKSSSFLLPKLSFSYGPSSIHKIILYDLIPGYQESTNYNYFKYGSLLGFGFFVAITKDRTAGLDFDYYFGFDNPSSDYKTNQFMSIKIKYLLNFSKD